MNGHVQRSTLCVMEYGIVQMEVMNYAIVEVSALIIATTRVTFAWILKLVIQHVYQRNKLVMVSSTVSDRLMNSNSVE